MNTKDKTVLLEMIERLGADEFINLVSGIISPKLKPTKCHEPKMNDDLSFRSFEIGIDHPDEYTSEDGIRTLVSHPYPQFESDDSVLRETRENSIY